jgi:hypothetical protein
MKFYIGNDYNNICSYWQKIINNKLNAVYSTYSSDHYIIIIFFKNGTYHNAKNASYNSNRHKEFYLDGEHYGSKNKFTKHLWRRFVKLQAFL